MSKTIEELAKQFTDELFAGDDLTDFDTQTEKNDAYVTCMAFGNHLMEQPLSVRLTAEEKERVRKAYESISEYGKDKSEECASCANYAARVWMERIFGKELFERKEEE